MKYNNILLVLLMILVVGFFIGFQVKSYQDNQANIQAGKALDSAFGFLNK